MESKKRTSGKKQQPGEIRKHGLERGLEDSERERERQLRNKPQQARRVWRHHWQGVHRPDFKGQQVGKKGREWVLKDHGGGGRGGGLTQHVLAVHCRMISTLLCKRKKLMFHLDKKQDKQKTLLEELIT